MAGDKEEIGKQALRHVVSLALDEDLGSVGISPPRRSSRQMTQAPPGWSPGMPV